MSTPTFSLQTSLWEEEASADDPFTAQRLWCRGYDLYGEMLGRCRWVELLYLLFRGERPSHAMAQQLEVLAVALANAGPRDPLVHAAMCGGVGGSPIAASLMAALAVGAGRCGGAQEINQLLQAWRRHGCQAEAWQAFWAESSPTDDPVWPPDVQAAGLACSGDRPPLPARQLLAALLAQRASPALLWLNQQQSNLRSVQGHPIGQTMIVAAALFDLGFEPAEGEALYLLLRLPGAAAHALEQERLGFKQFPFFQLDLQDDPRAGGSHG